MGIAYGHETYVASSDVLNGVYENCAQEGIRRVSYTYFLAYLTVMARISSLVRVRGSLTITLFLDHGYSHLGSWPAGTIRPF